LNNPCYISVLLLYEYNFDMREEKAAMLAAAIRVKAILLEAAIMSAEQQEREYRLVSVSAPG
jgi:hypothetical protein